VLFAAPAVPAPLTAAAARNAAGTRSTVTLTLPAAPAGVTYTVLRVTPAGLPGAGTATVLNNTTVSTFTDTNLRRSATPYIYQIRANGAAGSSAYATTSVLVN
jgi:hypothetical protein